MSDSPEHERLDVGPWAWDWFCERVLASWYLLVPLALLITLAGGARNMLVRGLVAFVCIVALRLWDDVEDLAHDRRHYPMRVLCRLPSSKGPRSLAYVGLVASCVPTLVLGGEYAPLAGATFAAAAGVYEARSVWPHLRVVFAHVILLKVPALAIALAFPAMPPRVVLGRALALYGVVGSYELLHDAEARRSPFALALALVDLVCLCAGLAVWLLHDRIFP
ncbi:hypothetical protein [Polyangium jinanense]|uniref:UbiA prenyltransferase family protein n=1 Tax=Polyangium jinanense TaxID=2829994 RepID=A0A9X3X888_9BACT|nr:hypothetical protein [Polyangium jinanense]MDC3954340.1 hypothetical protein [Polyangium jinanense]MDC3984208.1 hypothetical protein [Polyangium jinanense]